MGVRRGVDEVLRGVVGILAADWTRSGVSVECEPHTRTAEVMVVAHQKAMWTPSAIADMSSRREVVGRKTESWGQGSYSVGGPQDMPSRGSRTGGALARRA
jgi:hypothetical protein